MKITRIDAGRRKVVGGTFKVLRGVTRMIFFFVWGASSHFQKNHDFVKISWNFMILHWKSKLSSAVHCHILQGFHWFSIENHEISWDFHKIVFFFGNERRHPPHFFFKYFVWTTPLTILNALPMRFRCYSPIHVTRYTPPFEILRNFMVWTELPEPILANQQPLSSPVSKTHQIDTKRDVPTGIIWEILRIVILGFRTDRRRDRDRVCWWIGICWVQQ